jgi:hypothetical protein
MGFLDIFKKSSRPSLEQLSYDIAYQIFPAYAFSELRALTDILESSPDSADELFYFIACKAREIEPQRDEAAGFRWHKISGTASRAHLILEYPAPKPIDLSGHSFEDIKKTMGTWVLAPHFSGVVMDQANDKVSYFVLGQTSMGGGTALRHLTADGTNANLGAGPEPELRAFVAAVEQHVATAA